MKIYDKEMYEKQESMKIILLIIVVFLVGFFAGYMSNSVTHEKQESNNITVQTEDVQTENVNQQICDISKRFFDLSFWKY